MSWLSKAALYALKEAAKPALTELGRNVGQAVGKRFGRRLDPEGEASNADDEDTLDEEDFVLDDDPDDISEDERTP